MEKIAVGSDHAGFELKEKIRGWLKELGFEAEDFGTHSAESCDYPTFARAVAKAVSSGRFERGIICCGSGVGVSIVANKVRGIRAALCCDPETAELSRRHNNANVLCVGARSIADETGKEIVKTWINTAFEGGRHARRVGEIEEVRAGEDSEQWTGSKANSRTV